MRCLEPMIITEILRLKEMKFTYRDIGDSVGCSKTTVGEILSRCRDCGLSYEDAVKLPPERLNELIYPDSFGRKWVKLFTGSGTNVSRQLLDSLDVVQSFSKKGYPFDNAVCESFFRFLKREEVNLYSA